MDGNVAGKLQVSKIREQRNMRKFSRYKGGMVRDNGFDRSFKGRRGEECRNPIERLEQWGIMRRKKKVPRTFDGAEDVRIDRENLNICFEIRPVIR